MSASRRFDGKVAFVTGAGSGIGRAAALAFAAEGARVLVADANAVNGETVAAEISETGTEAAFVRCDVAKEDEVRHAVESAVARWGRLDCAFNNAGISPPPRRLADYEQAAWTEVIDINLKGVWLCMKYEIRQMLGRGGGSIVNNASAAGLVGVENMTAYAASKHGVVGLTRTAALEYATDGIRVNVVCPGVTWTPTLAAFLQQSEEARSHAVAKHPMARIAEPQEIAAAVVWLASDQASFVTGVALPVDGGMTAG